MRAPENVDVAVVGAGFAGLYMLKKLRERGLRAVVFERGSGVGGTWYWNRYPGARCDVESPYYSYSFDSELEQEWEWTERYPAQEEIRAYLDHVADRYELRRDIVLDTTVASAVYDEAAQKWDIATVGPDGGQITEATYCVMATGCLSASRAPDIEGLESFAGRVFHTGDWPHEDVDFSGRRVAVIGTGSSGIQSIPLIADQASELTVFQRTANYSVPAKNGPLDPELWEQVRKNYPEIRQQARQTPTGLPFPPAGDSAQSLSEKRRRQILEQHWGLGGFRIGQCFSDIAVDEQANEHVAEFIREKIDEIVEDPATAELLKPDDHPVGSKRICVDTDYYATFNRDHVRLVDVRSAPIESISKSGVQTSESHYEADDLVLATGFDAMTGALLKMDIRGRGGESLREKWQAGPRTYLGLSVAGFPNMFMITGPGSPSVLTNMVTSIEQHVEWIDQHLGYLQERGLKTSEADASAQDSWVQHVNDVAAQTLMVKANSWYLGANVPGKPRVFMPYVGGFNVYRDVCDDVAAKEYAGFVTA